MRGAMELKGTDGHIHTSYVNEVIPILMSSESS